MPTNPRGFTLIEALIVMAVVSLLLCLAVPAWTDAVAATRSSDARSRLYRTLLAADNHATATGVAVVVCASADGASCSRSPEWTRGWIAFADLDEDRAPDANETMLRREGALEGTTRLRSTKGRTRLVFQPFGGTPGSNVTFTLCDDRGPEKATTIVMANTTRLRQAKPSARAARECVSSG